MGTFRHHLDCGSGRCIAAHKSVVFRTVDAVDDVSRILHSYTFPICKLRVILQLKKCTARSEYAGC